MSGPWNDAGKKADALGERLVDGMERGLGMGERWLVAAVPDGVDEALRTVVGEWWP